MNEETAKSVVSGLMSENGLSIRTVGDAKTPQAKAKAALVKKLIEFCHKEISANDEELKAVLLAARRKLEKAGK